MNLRLFLNDQEILYRMHLMPTLSHQPCCHCEQPIIGKNHYRIQTIGASGRYLTFQVCEPCRGELYVEARARHPQLTDPQKPAPPLTKEELQIAQPKPINLGSRYAPKAHPTPPEKSAPSETSDMSAPSDLFNQEPL